MTTTPHSLSSGNFTQDWSNIALITTNDDWSSVPSIVGYLGDDASTTTAGLDPQVRTSDFTTVDVVANQTNPSITNGGVAEFHLTNPTIALQGSGGSDFPNIVIYLDSTGRTGITVSYNIRDIDASADNTNQQVALQYRTDGGAWINVPAAYVADATTGPSLATQVTAVSVTLPADAENKPNLQVRIITSNAPGNDEWVGIDDIVVSSTGAGPVVAPGQLSIADANVTEGNAATTQISFTVTRANGDDGEVGATWTATFGGGANDAGADDFEAGETFTGTVTFLDGETSKTIVLDVQGDLTVEPDEVFTVTLSAPTGGATLSDAVATGTIANDDLPPTPAATVADASIVEGQSGVTYLNFTVTLSFAPTGPVTIDYATANGTAAAGSDYLAVSGQLSFAAGETTKTISVPIVGDAVPEANETFTVTLSNPTGATIADNSATGAITSDDGSAYFSLASGNFSENWNDTSRITTNDNWSGVPFIVGYLGDINSGQPTGDDPRTVTGANLGTVDVIANQTNPATNTSGGVAEFHITDPTIALQGSGTADAPSIVLYMDASGRTDIRVQARLRDIDASADNAVQPVAVQYRTDPNGEWVNAPGGYFADVTTAGSATQETLLDIVLPADANNASTLQIRILTTNAAGSDEWVGIDDIAVSSNQGPASYSVSDAAAFEGSSVGGTTPITFTVTRAGDATQAGTVDYQLSFVGGGFSASASDIASPLSGTVSFAAGETVKTITVDVAADAVPEADEGFLVILGNPSTGSVGDGVGNGTIVNDDGLPPYITIADVTQAEGNDGTTLFTFTVTRTGGTGSGAFTVDYATTATGTATPGEDYEPTSGTLTFDAGENSKTFTVEVTGDLQGELAETFGVTLSNPTGNAVIADPTATGTIQNDDLLYIHQIQGSAYYSPILASEGTTSFDTASQTIVIVQAVVTAIDNQGTRQGFYITEERTDWDGSLLTSEGIFVMTRDDDGNGVEVATAIAGLAVGDLVTVNAKVMEYQAFQSMPRTMLVNPSSITIDGNGYELPTLVLDGVDIKIPNSIMTLVTPDYTDAVDNAGDTFDASIYALSFWETVEGMLVTVPDMIVADGFVSTSNSQPIFQAYSTAHADPDQINERGGYTVAGDPPNSPPDTIDDDQDATIAGGRHLHDGDINPDIIEIDFSGFAMPAPAGLINQLSMGDKLGDITGIVEFDFTDRKIFVTDYDGTQFVNTQPVRETTTLGSDGRSLTVATFNVENLDPGDGQARFDSIAEAIATNLNAPDILIIEEIQDNNGTAAGTADASVTWQMLVDALNARVPGANYQWVDQEPVNGTEGGAVNGSGNIRVGFLYDTNRVQLGDLPADATIEQRRQFTDRIGDGVVAADARIAFSDADVASEINTADWTNTRKSLLGQFTFNGNTVFVIGNHFTAKGGSGEFWQVNQDIAAGQPENSGFDRRVQQAEDVYHVMNLIESSATAAGVISGGDYNDFYFYRPLEVATGYVETDGTPRVGGERFDNLTLKLPEAERYTYTFDGRSQALDHLVASQGLAAGATIDVVHINTGYNALGTGADTSQRLSDHDPALAAFDMRSFGETIVGTAGGDELQGLGGNDRLQGGDGADTLNGGEGTDTAVYSEDAPYGVVVNLTETLSFPANGHPDATRPVGPNEAVDGFGNYDSLVSIENVVTGSKNDFVYGSDNANRIETGAGDDFIDGFGGADTMIGGSGNDVYVVDNAGDVVTEGDAEGTDRVNTSLSTYVLSANVENLFATGGDGPRDFRGNAGNNVVEGTNSNDVFRMQDGGEDTIRGFGGRDAIYFGSSFTAEDRVEGGEGNDILILQGDYSAGVVLGGGTRADATTGEVLSIESLSLFSGSVTSYGDLSGATYRYNVTSLDANVAAGVQMRVNGFSLLSGENLTFNGSAETDGTFQMLGGRGFDNLTGGALGDVFVFGHDGRFGEGDTIDGGAGYDFVYLRGDYSLDFTAITASAATFANVESIGLLSSSNTQYVSGGDGEFDYSIVWADVLMSGRTMTINGSRLEADETLSFDGSRETDGAFRIFGGAADDVLVGGAGNDFIQGSLGADTMTGGAGNDIFRFLSVADSPAGGDRDGIQDFTLGDIIDLQRIDADPEADGDQAFSFIGTGAFTGQRGQLRYENEAGNIWKVQGDVNGDGVADLEVLVVIADNHPLTAADFLV